MDMNQMASDLAETVSFENAIEKISKYVKNIDCEEFYLCLCDNWRSTYDPENGFIDTIITKGYTENMVCMLSYYDGTFHKEHFEFNSKNMIPYKGSIFYRESYGGNIYYYAPIHFHEKCLGYCIIGNSTFPLQNPMYHSWIINLSTCIENIRNKLSLEHMVNELDKLYVIDNLSKIYNRNGFYRFANAIYEKASASKDDIMVLFIDLDGLKYINDKFGHHEGDNAILTVAETIKECCIHDEVFARFGGDEFVIFSSNYTEDNAKMLCKEIERQLGVYNQKSDKPYKVGASMGYHITIADSNIPISNIISIADAKMYELKKQRHIKRNQAI
jgi:diguanylate cyclase (GGDEF)-like protein